MSLLLGCIADDFTGATDLANNLARGGLRVIQTMGVPIGPLGEDADAVVVALKSRTIAPAQAVEQSLGALKWLKAAGPRQIYFKVCSTFDSTLAGNIGPVTEALMEALGSDFCVVTPAFPDNGRTVFKGHLFAGDALLSESSMRHHPLTPMLDSNLVRVMQAQTKRRVGLIDYSVVARGGVAIRKQIAELKQQGIAIAIADAVSNADLSSLGSSLRDALVMTAGSGLAIGLAQNFEVDAARPTLHAPPASGYRAAISGSCSVATNRQVLAFARAGRPSLAIDPLRVASGVDVAAEALAWAEPLLKDGPVLIYSSAEPSRVQAVQGQLGVEGAGAMVEQTLSSIARGLVAKGVGQLVVAGGETSGACVQALGIERLSIGVQIDPGVPWCHADLGHAQGGLHIALKSGNFGDDRFFLKAFDVLDHAQH